MLRMLSVRKHGSSFETADRILGGHGVISNFLIRSSALARPGHGHNYTCVPLGGHVKVACYEARKTTPVAQALNESRGRIAEFLKSLAPS